jgi:hypothetical protein
MPEGLRFLYGMREALNPLGPISPATLSHKRPHNKNEGHRPPGGARPLSKHPYRPRFMDSEAMRLHAESKAFLLAH